MHKSIMYRDKEDIHVICLENELQTSDTQPASWAMNKAASL